ncbi:MAG: ferrous iron transport protein A [Anaerolineae bacterium]|nr:ferrous iron transport protein A [Anaerolineae bacterium]
MTPVFWTIVAVVVGLSISTAAVVTRRRDSNRHQSPVDEGLACHAVPGWRPLVDCPRNCDACLRCLHVDRCVVHRLRELGLTPGTEIRVVQDAGGPMLLSVRGSRVALGRDLAKQIWVEIDSPAPALDKLDKLPVT